MSQLHIASGTIQNFGPFKGTHAIVLGPGVFGVTAAREGDDEDSNGVGKSWFLSSIPFALFGWHMADSEDGIISDDAKTTTVRYVLSDGTEIERSRKKSTQLLVKLPGQKEQKGDPAQAALLAHLGMTQKDYFATSFFKQKEISRLVTMSAADRQELVRSWLELGRLEDCEQMAWEEAKEAQEAETKLVNSVETQIDMHWEDVARRFLPEGKSNMSAEEDRAELLELIRLQTLVVSSLETGLQRAASEYGHTLQVEAALQFKEISAEGIKLKAERDAMPEVQTAEIEKAEEAAITLRNKYAALAQDHARALEASNCRFDGKCPIAGIECPAKDKINGNLDEAIAHADKLTAETNALITPMHEAEDEAHRLREAQRVREKIDVRLEELRKQAAKAMQGYQGTADEVISGEPKDGEQSAEERLREAKALLKQASGDLAVMQAAIDRADQLEASRATAEQRQAAARRVAAARATAKIYRRAQRLVAERNMGEVERRANDSLAGIGSRLKVQLSWSREGSSVASTCGECGNAFPKSLKAKVCDRCGAKRGPAQIDQLEVALSDWSGGLEDLAGVTVQLAAAAWLRGRKGMRWASACIDEPFGALDAKNRRALSGQLASLIRDRSGFEQAFVVAHDRAIMNALPNRIVLVGGREGTRFG
jgi:DNA repair exonuclease SbcCD ATPase subunit